MKLFNSLFLLCFLLLLRSNDSSAASLTSYRIYLDPQNNNTSFLVFNREQKPQSCKINLRHYPFNKEGKIQKEVTDSIPTNSAKEWIRYSPRKFDIQPGSSQTIRFAMRRKPGREAAEYRSFVEIDCVKQQEKSKQLISIEPRLVHNVPIIVRTGKLAAEASFENFEIDESGVLSFKLRRKGERSIFGLMELLDDKDNLIGFIRGISVYPESDSIALSFPTKGVDSKVLKVRFTEDKTYGGSLVIESGVQL